jgi:hypothetical protein
MFKYVSCASVGKSDITLLEKEAGENERGPTKSKAEATQTQAEDTEKAGRRRAGLEKSRRSGIAGGSNPAPRTRAIQS